MMMHCALWTVVLDSEGFVTWDNANLRVLG